MFQSLESKGGGINDGIGNQNEKKKKEGYLLVLRKPVGNEWAITWRSMVGFISGRASDTAPRLVWSLSFSNIFSNSWSNVCNQCCECHVVCWKFPGIIPFLRGRFHKWGNSREMASQWILWEKPWRLWLGVFCLTLRGGKGQNWLSNCLRAASIRTKY